MTEARFLLGLCQRDLEDWPAARATLELVVKGQPADPGPRDALSEVYGALGDTERMLDQLEALSLLEPTGPNGWWPSVSAMLGPAATARPC